MFLEFLIAVATIIGLALIFGTISYGFLIGLITLVERIEEKHKQNKKMNIADDIYNLSLSPKIVEGYNYLHQVLYSCDKHEAINGVKEWGEDWCNRIKSYYLRKKIYHPIAVEKLFYDLKSEWVGECINAKWNTLDKLFYDLKSELVGECINAK